MGGLAADRIGTISWGAPETATLDILCSARNVRFLSSDSDADANAP